MADQNARQNTSYGSLTGVFLMIFSLALLLILLGIYLLVALHSAEITRFLKESTTIVFELKEGVDQDQRDLLTKKLTADPRLIAGSSLFVSKSEAIDFMKDELGERFLPDSIENPFSDIVSVKVKAAYTESNELEGISKDYMKQPDVRAVHYQNGYLDYWKVVKKSERHYQKSRMDLISTILLQVLPACWMSRI